MRRKYIYPLRVLLGIKCYLCLQVNVIFVCRKQNVKMIIEYPQTSHVGAYRIRPNAPTNPRGCF